jgi:cell shape-determining protein MreC
MGHPDYNLLAKLGKLPGNIKANVDQAFAENEALKKENEALKLEVEELKIKLNKLKKYYGKKSEISDGN